VHGRSGIGSSLRERGLPFAAKRAQTLEPGPHRPRVGTGSIGQGFQRDAGIGADGGIEWAIEAPVPGVNIDLDESGTGREQARPAHRQTVVDALADDEEQVGFAEGGVNCVVERRVGVAHDERVVVGDRAAPHADGVERDLSELDEAAERIFGARPPDTAAGDQDGPLGSTEQGDNAIRVGQALWPVKRWACQ